ncbi:putative reverse transcriptase domain-containing protein [Tanacetum coccineum]
MLTFKAVFLKVNKVRETRYIGGHHLEYYYKRFDALPFGNLLFMSSASSTVTYTSVYTDSEPGRVFWGADGGDTRWRLPHSHPQPSSPDYVPGPEHPPSPIEIPYVPEPEYPEYLVPSEDEAPMEDQPLPADASPATLSSGYVPDSDLEEDPKEDSEEHADYPADGGDGDDEPSGDDSDDDTDDDDEEPFEDEEKDDEERRSTQLRPTLLCYTCLLTTHLFPIIPAGDTKAFETDESAPTPRPPQIRIPFAQTRLRRARKTVRPEPPMSASMEARIGRAPLGYRAVGIRMRVAAASPPLSLPSTSPRTDILEAEMPPQKRACLTIFNSTPPRKRDLESSAAEPRDSQGHTPEVDNIGRDCRGLRSFRDRPYPSLATQLWLWIERRNMPYNMTSFERENAAIEHMCRTLERHQVATLITQTTSLQTRLTTALGRIATLEARDPEPQDGPAEADSSCMHLVPSRECLDVRGTARKGSSIRCFIYNAHVTALKKDITDKYWPPGRESKSWKTNIEPKGEKYRFDDLQLAIPKLHYSDRMCREESAKVERYVGWSPDMLHGAMLTAAERQAENKRKIEDTLRNNQNQQQPFKRNNVARAYTAGPGDKKPNGGTKPLCAKCNYHHDGPCTQKCTNCKKIGHSARDCNVRPTANNNNNNNNNNQRTQGTRSTGGHYAMSVEFRGPFKLMLCGLCCELTNSTVSHCSLIDIIPTTLDHGYDVELADGIPHLGELQSVRTRRRYGSFRSALITGIKYSGRKEREIYSKNKQEHAEHLKLILELLKKEQLRYQVDPARFEIRYKIGHSPKSARRFCQFFGPIAHATTENSLKDSQRSAKPMTKLTQKKIKGMLMHREKAIAYLTTTKCSNEKNYTTHDMVGVRRSSVCSKDLEALLEDERLGCELLSDYIMKSVINPGKANVVVDAYDKRNE